MDHLDGPTEDSPEGDDDIDVFASPAKAVDSDIEVIETRPAAKMTKSRSVKATNKWGLEKQEVKDLTDSLTPELKTLFRKDAIALWLLEARSPTLGDLITGIGPLQSLLTADDIEAQAVGERDESTIELLHGDRLDTTLDDDQITEAGRRQQRRQTALILSILGANAKKAGPSLLVNPVKAATSGSCLRGSDLGHVEIECSGCCAPREQCECAWSDGGAMGGEHAGAAVATTHPNPRPSNGATGRALDRASTRVYHSQREDVDLTVLD